MFGLLQLEYFGKDHHAGRADAILQRLWVAGAMGDVETDGCYPFAVAGINISSFLVALFREGCLDRLLMEGRRSPNMGKVHELYCHIFRMFEEEWLATGAKNVMAFPRVMAQVE